MGPWQRHMPPYENKDTVFGECKECVAARKYYEEYSIWIYNNMNFHMGPIEWWKRRHRMGII